jgi:hypothetical protein
VGRPFRAHALKRIGPRNPGRWLGLGWVAPLGLNNWNSLMPRGRGWRSGWKTGDGGLAQTADLWGLRFPEGICGSPRPTTKSRGPTEQVRTTIVHLSRLVERHAVGEYCRNPVCQMLVRAPAATKSWPPPASCLLLTAYCPKATVYASPPAADCLLLTAYCLLFPPRVKDTSLARSQ